MAWLAVDSGGQEIIFGRKPIRYMVIWLINKEVDRDINDQFKWEDELCSYINITKGSIKKLIGRDLTWEDEPVEI